jgi:hypothetical protein
MIVVNKKLEDELLMLPTEATSVAKTRRVRFRVDENNQIVLDVNTTARVELTEEEKTQMWWSNVSGLQRKNKQNEFKELVRQTSENEEYIAKFRQALDLCNNSSSKYPLQNVPLVSDCPARGIERVLFPELGQYRRQGVRTIVLAQSRLPPKMSLDLQQKLLGATSKRLSRPSRRLARLLGIGDAMVAAVL